MVMYARVIFIFAKIFATSIKNAITVGYLLYYRIRIEIIKHIFNIEI